MAARKSGLSIDFSAFSDLIGKLDELGADIEDIVADAMEQTAETVENDTIAALESSNLPAGGKYSSGDTKASVVRDAKAEKKGFEITIDLGFDKTKPGAGGWLITGTPKMKPDYALEDIYGKKKYETQLKKDINQLLQDELEERLGK